MNVLMVSAEYAPLVKVGGLADAVAGLAGALAARGHDVRVAVPCYGATAAAARDAGYRPAAGPPVAVRVGQSYRRGRWWERARAGRGPRLYLLEAPEVFDGDVYDRAGGAALALERAALLAQAALLLPGRLGWPVDVVHAHDAHAALVPLCRRLWFGADTLPGPAATALTIHNLAHQEIHTVEAAAAAGLPAATLEFPGPLEFHGRANLMKGAIVTADAVNTVSPSYAAETVATEAFGCGLQGALAARGDAYRGILNGADYRAWNPRTDRALPAPFSTAALDGRRSCRLALRAELGLSALSPERPLCGFVGRLVAQKGVELLLPLLERLADDGLGFALLGSGDAALEARLRALAEARPERLAFVRGFDDALARRIYGGCDLFLMPSLFEPCGLGQMYALRYGAPPVVRRTGGLADTVVDAGLPDGDGFVFEEPRADALLAALRRAEALWAEPSAWSALQRRGMGRRFDWARAAADYERMYSRAGARPGQDAGKDEHDGV